MNTKINAHPPLDITLFILYNVQQLNNIPLLLKGVARSDGVFMEISEKEFAVMQEISNNHLPDQRDIAAKTGFSLGLTNLIIRRLIKKGYLKAKQLNRKKIQYILTPKGFKEKAKKSYNYTLKTINALKTIKSKIQSLISEQASQGASKFVLIGNSELADIAEMAFKSLNINYIKNGEEPSEDDSAAIEYTKANTKNRVNLLDFLSGTGLFL